VQKLGYLHINLKLSMSFPRYCGMSDKFFEINHRIFTFEKVHFAGRRC
jgi:hypothetical protein